MLRSLTAKVLFAAGVATVVTSVSSAPAKAFQVFTDRTAWETALNGSGLMATPQEMFNNDIIGTNGTSITFDNGVVSQGFGGISENFVKNGTYHGTVDQGSDSPVNFDTITWTFPSLTRAFGADWGSTSNASGLQVEVDGQTTVFGDVPNFLGKGPGQVGFLGFIADNSFSSVTFSPAGRSTVDEFFQADQLSYSVAVPTSIPTPTLLPGLIGMGVAALRKRKGEATDTMA